jgi:hypothetical protein
MWDDFVAGVHRIRLKGPVILLRDTWVKLHCQLLYFILLFTVITVIYSVIYVRFYLSAKPRCICCFVNVASSFIKCYLLLHSVHIGTPSVTKSHALNKFGLGKGCVFTEPQAKTECCQIREVTALLSLSMSDKRTGVPFLCPWAQQLSQAILAGTVFLYDKATVVEDMIERALCSYVIKICRWYGKVILFRKKLFITLGNIIHFFILML